MTGLDGVTHALTLVCPWAALVVEGPKGVENRSWKPPAWVIGQRIAIHAGKKEDRESGAAAIFESGVCAGLWSDDRDAWKFRGVRGAIVGTAVVTGFHEDPSKLSRAQRAWFFGPVGWVLEDRRPLETPVPHKGALGLWKIDRDVIAPEVTQ